MKITLTMLSSHVLRVTWLPHHASGLLPHSVVVTQAFLCCRLHQVCPFGGPLHWQFPWPELVLSQIPAWLI